MTPLAALLAGSLEPPLDPSGDEARRMLRRELADPKYYDANILQRLMDWLGRLVDDTISGVSASGPLSTLLAIIVALALVAAIILIVSRARRTAQADRRPAAALTDEVITAAELRSRAEAALAAGDASAALVDAFRALAVRQVERERIEDVPQATAHELARALAVEFPAQAGAVHHGADLFDQTLYGERRATREQALELLALDDALAGRAARR
ncbi:mRNA-degrading endonuclease toxin of MazEF toxin-antitoxin module [Nocardioides aromaticivorans]|uniref:mRNA-degrading endonuclease toxin of MazEF toxin-antitoxin module n=1 Tax=Nocardioides aromaticivorans TaxID=200618 RepID=A0A7Y9ZKN8_9ACTN|nr:DUF4129 domain-containing protein [Nocardioides aromaticivorans]NYI46118.1 mRNA-degrading endonuclease toxin of MazEF toxin-antitoxin module [Nocardioides aromaticivorans]